MNIGMDIDLTEIGCDDITKLFFSENHGVIIQSELNIGNDFSKIGVDCHKIGKINNVGLLNIKNFEKNFHLIFLNIGIYGTAHQKILIKNRQKATKGLRDSIIIKINRLIIYFQMISMEIQKQILSKK